MKLKFGSTGRPKRPVSFRPLLEWHTHNNSCASWVGATACTKQPILVHCDVWVLLGQTTVTIEM